jgi:hypothetical protein
MRDPAAWKLALNAAISEIEFAPSATTAKTYGAEARRFPTEERQFMAIHLTPTELGREAGMHRREVITKCMELGVPIFQGRIDKTLFLGSLKEMQDKRQLAKA